MCAPPSSTSPGNWRSSTTGGDDFKGHRNIAFPTFGAPATFDASFLAEHFDPSDYADLRTLQPFTDPEGPAGTLKALRDLWNDNKHTRLQDPVGFLLEIRARLGHIVGPQPQARMHPGGRVRQGDLLLRLDWGPATKLVKDVTHEMDWMPMFVRPNGAIPIWETLADGHAFVRDKVIPMFHERFRTDVG